MKKTATTPKRKLWVVGVSVLVLAAVAVGIFLVTNKDKNTSPADNQRPAGTITVEGNLNCLPHKDPNAPATLECAFGITDTQGKHYALRADTPSVATQIGQTGKRARVSGTLTSTEDTKYDIAGTIAVQTVTIE